MDDTFRPVFGPVPSRRLGQSLGIDPVRPKTCNWNCVYCQLGRSAPLIAERKEYVSAEEIIATLKTVLQKARPGSIDWITFVGSGETTLNSRLGWMIRQVKQITDLPVAVITNGSLLYRQDVREELAAADAVLPTLDAGTPELYRKINRPWPEPTYEQYLQGLIDFRRMYRGKYWLEIMLVKGMNDTEEALHDLAAQILRIAPDKVHLTLPDRPAAEPWVKPPDEEGIMRALAILGKSGVEVVHPRRGSFDISAYTNPTEAILAILARHPMRDDEIIATLHRWAPEQAREALETLRRSGKVQIVERYGVRFWALAGGKYA